jgi:hypothetical protein
MSAPSRRPETRRRRARKEKIDKLRKRYEKASGTDRDQIFTKVKVLSPQMTIEQFTKKQ